MTFGGQSQCVTGLRLDPGRPSSAGADEKWFHRGKTKVGPDLFFLPSPTPVPAGTS